MHAFMYQPIDTVIHRLSPVTKIIGLGSLFLLSVLSSDLIYLIALTSLILGIITLSSSWPLVRRIWFLLIVLFFFPAVLWSFYYAGQTCIFQAGRLAATREGLEYGISMGLRLSGMLLAGLILLGTTRIEDFTSGLQYLGIPYRISFALSLAFRLVPVFFNTFSVISQAQKSRGLNIRQGGLVRRIRATLPLLIPVLVMGLRQTDQLAIALESKGFGFSNRRTTYHPVVIRRTDRIVIVILLAAIVSIGLTVMLH